MRVAPHRQEPKVVGEVNTDAMNFSHTIQDVYSIITSTIEEEAVLCPSYDTRMVIRDLSSSVVLKNILCPHQQYVW